MTFCSFYRHFSFLCRILIPLFLKKEAAKIFQAYSRIKQKEILEQISLKVATFIDAIKTVKKDIRSSIREIEL